MTSNQAPTPNKKPGARFEALDLLRLLAVGAVIAFHYGFRGAMGDDHLSVVWLPSIAPFAIYGYMGVKLFFVISGFVISFSAQNRSVTQFATARACRIYPAFLFCMSATFLVTLVLGGAVFQASIGKWLANATMIIPARSLQFTMDGAYWSIYAEIVFYGWIAVLIATGWFARNLTMAMMIWLVISAINLMMGNPVLVEKLFLTNQSGFFAAGVMLFVLRERDRSPQSFFVLGCATALGVFQALNETSYFITFIHAPLNAVTVALLSVGCVGLVAAATTIKRTPLPSALVVALGGLTYPLYLLHQNIGYMIFNRGAGHMPDEILVALVALAMLAASFLTWRYIDVPGQRLMRAALTSYPRFRPVKASPQDL